jgi:hypothetical protein
MYEVSLCLTFNSYMEVTYTESPVEDCAGVREYYAHKRPKYDDILSEIRGTVC